ncbi:MAG: homocysteine S-methyltransferase family protein [Anaerolineae bacterium]|nr:homocysteine S-methyltransferase family protein [Anaerolineae bacterium]
MNATLRDILSQPGVLIADGATGTFLQQVGLPRGMAPERWNLENPNAILALHRSYLDAGAQLILTNSFGGNRYRLARHGLAEQLREVNLTAAQLARQAAGTTAWVLGDIGPLGELLAPLGSISYEDAVTTFSAQTAALVEGGVDGILIETMSDLGEVKAAVEGARRVTDLPVLVTMSFDTRGRTMMGITPTQAAHELWALGVDVVGANCGRSLPENLEAIRAMREAEPQAVLMAKPNAGLPHTAGDTLRYEVTPEVMADYAVRFVALGVKIFGGCCGSTPEHIRAVVRALRG